MARQGKETLESIERDIRENNAKRYVWMVVSNGTSHGEYEGNSASACLFATEKEAIDHVKGQLAEIVADNVLGGIVLSFEVLGAAIEKHCKWFGKYEAQFRDGDSVTDFNIERTAVPNPPRKKRRK